MTVSDRPSRPSVDTRTRSVGAAPPVDPAAFWAGEWRDALARHGERAAADAERLDLPPLAIAVDDDVWTLRRSADDVEVVPGRDAALEVSLDRDAFADLVHERRTALGLVIGARVAGEPRANEAFCAWDPVLRSVLDGRGVYRPGDVTLCALDGSPLDLDQQFRLGDDPTEASHFLAEAGFLLADGRVLRRRDGRHRCRPRARGRGGPPGRRRVVVGGDAGRRPLPVPHPQLRRASRMSLRALLADPRFLAIGEILGDGHRPGDPFGEHFADVTAEGLVKRVGSVEGLACLPWHKDCDRGGHSMYCSGLTAGICLTPVDVAHGGLDVVAGSHRANIARAQVDRGLDLPSVTLRAERGDLTLHLSCTLHRSTHPASRERRVAYTGFTLPPRPGDHRRGDAQGRLERERADIGDPSRRGPAGVRARASERPTHDDRLAMRFPELGIYLLPGHSDRPADLLDEVRAAEALGLGSAWISERFDVKEVGALAGAAAAVTKEIWIGSGVTNIDTRHPLLLASLAHHREPALGRPLRARRGTRDRRALGDARPSARHESTAARFRVAHAAALEGRARGRS